MNDLWHNHAPVVDTCLKVTVIAFWSNRMNNVRSEVSFEGLIIVVIILSGQNDTEISTYTVRDSRNCSTYSL